MKCPVCGSEDYVQYVFVLHCKPSGIISKENPGNNHWIYECPNGHIYGETIGLVKVKEQE